MALSDLTRRLVERHCLRYCDPVCPPWFARQVRLSYRIDGDDVWLNELRPLFRSHNMNAMREVPLARLRFEATSSDWRLHYCDRRGRVRPYAALPRSRDFLRLLREIDRDPHGIFWHRVNGASLRWCSSRGRCPDCDARYSSIVDGRIGAGNDRTTAARPLNRLDEKGAP